MRRVWFAISCLFVQVWVNEDPNEELHLFDRVWLRDEPNSFMSTYIAKVELGKDEEKTAGPVTPDTITFVKIVSSEAYSSPRNYALTTCYANRMQHILDDIACATGTLLCGFSAQNAYLEGDDDRKHEYEPLIETVEPERIQETHSQTERPEVLKRLEFNEKLKFIRSATAEKRIRAIYNVYGLISVTVSSLLFFLFTGVVSDASSGVGRGFYGLFTLLCLCVYGKCKGKKKVRKISNESLFGFRAIDVRPRVVMSPTGTQSKRDSQIMAAHLKGAVSTTPVAIKMFRTNGLLKASNELPKASLQLLSLIDSKLLVKTYGICDDLSSVPAVRQLLREHNVNENDYTGGVIIFERCGQGDIETYIRQNRPLRVSRICNFAAQMASSLAYLHRLRFVHRDPFCRNFYLRSDGSIALGDFDLVRPLSDDERYEWMTEGGRMPILRAPELNDFQTRVYTRKTDVFQFGCSLWELFALNEGLNRPDDVEEGQYLDFFEETGERELVNTMPSGVAKLIRLCLSVNPEKRPFMDELELPLESIASWAKHDEDDSVEEKQSDDITSSLIPSPVHLDSIVTPRSYRTHA